MKALVFAMVLLAFAPARGAERTFGKLLVIGDSISFHEPAEEIGWSGNWGMAASEEDSDYVHIFLRRIAHSQGGMTPELKICARGGGTLAGQQENLGEFANFAADLAVVQMGENDNSDVSEAGFQKPYENLLRTIREANAEAVILCLGVWSPPSGSAVKDEMIRAAAKKYGALFADLQKANADPENMAASEKRFSHKGVAWHPGDAGMKAYADALWKVLKDPRLADHQAARVAAGTGRAIFQEKWESSTGWSPEIKPGQGSLEISSTGKQSLLYEKSLPAEQLRGRRIILKTRIKGTGISAKPESWNGVKILLKLHNAEGKDDYPQAELPVGTFDWREVAWPIRVPDNIVEASLVLGLENVSGRAWFGPLEIIDQP